MLACPPMRLLFCGSGWLPMIDRIAQRLPAGHGIAHWDRRRPLADEVADVDVILPSNGLIDAGVIAAATRLRLIQQPAAGVDNIDREAARARGIPVCNAPGANPIAVAEAALLLLLSLARRAPAAAAAFARAEIGTPLGVELTGRTLGIVGMGRTGRALAERATGLGMRVEPFPRSAGAAERARFFGGCDAISLHCPLTDETRGLIDAAALAAMRPGAFLLNLARGPIIDRAALEAALAGGRLGGVGLDVFWEEPWDPADPLWRDPRVVVLPHVAGSTEESFGRIADIVVENVDRIGRGAPLLHRLV
jgi:phosphoglycerate dehydrogenase-like enzyme